MNDAPPGVQYINDLAAQLEEHARGRSSADIETLAAMLRTREDGTYEKHIVPRLVARALIACGPMGVDALRREITSAPGYIYPQVILEALWHASRGQLAPDLGVAPPTGLLTQSIPSDTREAAERAVRDVFAEALIDEDSFSAVISFMHTANLIPRDGGADARAVFETLSEASIKISLSLIDDLERLVAAGLREEDYHSFFAEHPVFLDPLASEVVTKQRLGLEHVTDFAVRRHDDRWILVEIEKPQDSIFTGANDFSAPFTHAFGQVLDFQRWVEDNGPYARRSMPLIASPRGILVMGRTEGLPEEAQGKLRRWNANSGSIEALTYDAVLVRARHLYENLHHRRTRR